MTMTFCKRFASSQRLCKLRKDLLYYKRHMSISNTISYDRIVHKIMSVEDRRIRQKMAHLLEWITYSQRPLSVDELLSALALDPSELGDQLPKALSPKVLDFCKPLIDIPLTGPVDFVHFSARE